MISSWFSRRPYQTRRSGFLKDMKEELQSILMEKKADEQDTMNDGISSLNALRFVFKMYNPVEDPRFFCCMLLYRQMGFLFAIEEALPA